MLRLPSTNALLSVCLRGASAFVLFIYLVMIGLMYNVVSRANLHDSQQVRCFSFPNAVLHQMLLC